MRLLLGIGVGLTIATGALHAYLAYTYLDAGFMIRATQFAALALPYLVAALLVALGIRRRLWIRIGIGYVVLVIVIWAVFGEQSDLAYATKAIELALLAALVGLELLARRA